MEYKVFVKVVEANGFAFNRQTGDHRIYINDKGRHISIPLKLHRMIARRLIKENNLNLNIKEAKRELKAIENLPPGASSDPRAPYNEELNVDTECYISITISKPVTISTQPNPSDDLVNELVKKEVRDNIKYCKNNGYNVDDIAIIKE